MGMLTDAPSSSQKQYSLAEILQMTPNSSQRRDALQSWVAGASDSELTNPNTYAGMNPNDMQWISSSVSGSKLPTIRAAMQQGNASSYETARTSDPGYFTPLRDGLESAMANFVAPAGTFGLSTLANDAWSKGAQESIDPGLQMVSTVAGAGASYGANNPQAGVGTGATGTTAGTTAGTAGASDAALMSDPVLAGEGGALWAPSTGGAAYGTGAGTTGGMLSGGSTAGGVAGSSFIPGVSNGALIGTGLNMLGGYMQGSQAKDAAQTSADAQIQAAKIAAEAAKFKPVGVTTRFGSSKFGYDPQGNLTSAGYTLSPEMKAQQDALMGVSNNMLTQYQGAQSATAPMGQAAQTMFTLGNNYLSTTPEQQAQKYMEQQQALLAGSRASELSGIQERLNAQGRSGLSVGGGGGMTSSNPELQAYYNSLRQQDLGLAAQATQGGMDYAKFGAGMVGSGGQMLSDMYGTQSAAYSPYQTAMGGVGMLEGMGQQALDTGINLGAKGAAAGANVGNSLLTGGMNAARTAQVGNSWSPWGDMLAGAGNAISNYSQPQQQYMFDPYSGRALT